MRNKSIEKLAALGEFWYKSQFFNFLQISDGNWNFLLEDDFNGAVAESDSDMSHNNDVIPSDKKNHANAPCKIKFGYQKVIWPVTLRWGIKAKNWSTETYSGQKKLFIYSI